MDVYEVSTRRKHTRIAISQAAAARETSADVNWTVGDHILLTWSSGTNAANGVVYTTNGKTLLQLSVSGLATSPSMRYLVTFPTARADPSSITLYDLASGGQVAQKSAPADVSWTVKRIEWQGRQFVAHCLDTADTMHEVRIDLEAQP